MSTNKKTTKIENQKISNVFDKLMELEAIVPKQPYFTPPNGFDKFSPMTPMTPMVPMVPSKIFDEMREILDNNNNNINKRNISLKDVIKSIK